MFVVTKQVPQLIGEALYLQDAGALHRSGCPDYRIARTDQDIRVGIDRTHPVSKVPDEAVMQATEAFLTRLAQIQIGEEAPDADGQVADQRLLELAEPGEEAGCQPPGNAVGQQEIDVL